MSNYRIRYDSDMDKYIIQERNLFGFYDDIEVDNGKEVFVPVFVTEQKAEKFYNEHIKGKQNRIVKYL